MVEIRAIGRKEPGFDVGPDLYVYEYKFPNTPGWRAGVVFKEDSREKRG